MSQQKSAKRAASFCVSVRHYYFVFSRYKFQEALR